MTVVMSVVLTHHTILLLVVIDRRLDRVLGLAVHVHQSVEGRGHVLAPAHPVGCRANISLDGLERQHHLLHSLLQGRRGERLLNLPADLFCDRLLQVLTLA